METAGGVDAVSVPEGVDLEPVDLVLNAGEERVILPVFQAKLRPLRPGAPLTCQP